MYGQCDICRRSMGNNFVRLDVRVRDKTCFPEFEGDGHIEIDVCKSCFESCYDVEARTSKAEVIKRHSGPMIAHNSEKVNRRVIGGIFQNFMKWLRE